MTAVLPPPPPGAGPSGSRSAPTDAEGQPSSSVPDGVRPGDLTLVWRSILVAGWLGTFLAYAAVWQASVQLGIAVWWVGPRSQPTPIIVRIVPFLIAVIVILLIIYNVRRLVEWSLGAAVVTSLIALPDFSRSIGLAVTELAITGALVIISLMSMTGRYRLSVDASATPSATPAATPGATPGEADGSPDVRSDDASGETSDGHAG